MRHAILTLLFFAAASAASRGQDKIVEMFDGATTLTTGTFIVQDKWELRWSGASSLAITVVNADGSIAAGTSATANGSLYQPQGGTFYLQVVGAPSGSAASWHVSVVQLGSQPDTNGGTAYVPPEQIAPPDNKPATPPPLGPLTLAKPNPVPSSIGTSTGIARVSDAQTRAIVLIKGDVGEGTGFLTHAADGTPVVITNIHVISANPNVKITTTQGREIPVLAYRGATDRDLVMMTIKDDNYSYLELATNVDHLVHEGDQVLTPGNSEGGGVFLDTSGQIRGIGPDRIEISNPFFHGNSGGPVLHVASGKVISAVYMFSVVDPSDLFDAGSLANPGSAITGKMRYFSVRIDTVPAWEKYDPDRFLAETTFLSDFHRQSRLLDSFLNGRRYEKAGLPVTDDDEGMLPDSHYYLHDDAIKRAADVFHQQASNADQSQQIDAGRELASDLTDIATKGMADIQTPANFYKFDRIRTKTEIEYRKAILEELSRIDDHIVDLGH